MATVSYNSSDRAIERDCVRLYYKVAFATLTAGDEDVVLLTLPHAFVVLDVGITCSVADVAATSTRASIRDGTTAGTGVTGAIYAGTADNGGTASVRDVAECVTTEVAAPSAGSTETLILRNTTVGTATTAPTFLVWVDVLRTSF